jgi:hypothetical protein
VMMRTPFASVVISISRAGAIGRVILWKGRETLIFL